MNSIKSILGKQNRVAYTMKAAWVQNHIINYNNTLLMVKKIAEKAVKVEERTQKQPKVKQEPLQPTPKQEEQPIPQEKPEEIEAGAASKQKAARNKGKQNRLIIRNLVFDIGEKHLRKLLTPYGEIEDIEVPTNPNSNHGNRGFAFVEFKSYRACQKAIKELNQSSYKGRTIVLDFSVSKQRFMTTKLGDEEEGQEKQEEQAPKEEIEEEKEVKKEEKKGKKGKKGKKAEKEEQKPIVEEVVDQEEVIRLQREAQDLSSTIFIRNLPVGVSQDQLREFFAKYGKVRWARVVIDRNTNTPKGTAFVRFVDPKMAHEIIEYSRSYEMFLMNKNPRFRSDPRLSLELDGTILKVFPSEKRETIAEKVRQREEKVQEKNVKVKPLKKIKRLNDLIRFDKDGKRKVALAEFGLWEPTEDMSEEDRARFAAHSKEKIEKLKNPNNSVSDKRIILKYLDKNIIEEQLQDLAHEFLRAHHLRPKELTYCKLMLDQQRKRSAGFAFIEFAHHEHSKTFIEELSESYNCLSPRPYVIEFAIQDSRKLLKLQARQK